MKSQLGDSWVEEDHLPPTDVNVLLVDAMTFIHRQQNTGCKKVPRYVLGFFYLCGALRRRLASRNTDVVRCVRVLLLNWQAEVLTAERRRPPSLPQQTTSDILRARPHSRHQ